MPSFLSKLLGKKKHSDNSGLLDGERYEAVPADTPPQPSGTVPENEPSNKSSTLKSKGHGLGLHLKRRAQSPPPPPEREPISPAPHLSLDLPSSQAEEKQLADLNLGLANENQGFSEAILRQKRLTPAETLYLIQKTSEVIQERGLEVLGVMRPHWFASPNHQEAQLKLLNCLLQSLAVRSSNEGTSSSMTSEDPFENELRYTRDPHDVAAVFRWGLRHLQLENNAFALTTVQDWYQTFVTSERSEGYSPQAFDHILPPLLPATHMQLVRSVLDLLTSLAAHSEENGISGNKLSKALGWWLISPRNVVKESQWPSFYSDWETAARQFEHLFLTYIRNQETQSRMPKRLTELVRNYPFEKYRKSGDGVFLPRTRFSTRTTDALFIRIAVQASSESTVTHPLQIIIDALNSLPDKDASGDYLAIWQSIREAAKTSTEEENQDTSSTKFNLSAVIADESLRLLSLIPGMNDIPDISGFPSHASRRSFSLVERPLSLASTSDQRGPADKANSVSTPNMDLELVTDWQAFSTTGFRSPSGISLNASLWDNDVEVSTPPMRRNTTKHTLSFSSSSEPPLPEEPTTPPVPSQPAAAEQPTMPVEVSNSRVATFSSPSLVKLDEAFVDFWADTLLDSVAQSWPTFVVCQLKPMPNLKVKDSTKSIEWIVIEQVVAPPVVPVKEAEPEPVPPVPSTPPKSDSHKSYGFFSFTSPSRKRWSLFSSKHDTAPPLGRRRSGSKVSEMGEILKEDDETPKPPSDVSMTVSQSEESSSAVAPVSKLEPLESVQEVPKLEEPVSEEHPKTDHLSPIQEDVKLEEATTMGAVTEQPAGSEVAIPESLPPVPSKGEVEEAGPELPPKEKELPELAIQNQVKDDETLTGSKVESDAVIVDDAVPLGESAVIVPEPAEKELPKIDDSERTAEAPGGLESIPVTEEPGLSPSNIQKQPDESVPQQETAGKSSAAPDPDSKAAVPTEIGATDVVADESSRESAVSATDRGLKLDTESPPRSDMSFTVVEATPVEDFGASIMSPATAEPVITSIKEEDEPDTLEAGKEGYSQGFEFVQESESAEAEAGDTVAHTEAVPSGTLRVLEPVKSQSVADVPEEPSSISGQQAEETTKDESPREVLLLNETAPTEGSQTTVPEFAREKEAHVEGTANEAPHPAVLEETSKIENQAPEVSTDKSIPIASAEEITPGPPSVKERNIVHDAPGEITPAQEVPLTDETSAVSAVVPEEASSTVNEEKDQVSAAVERSTPEAAPASETTAVKDSHIHEDVIPTEGETARVDTSAAGTVPDAETADVLPSEVVSSVDKEAGGETTAGIGSAAEETENMNVENATTSDAPIVDKTTVLQIPVIDSSEEPPAAPAAEVVSVPKVAVIDEEEPLRSEATIHAPAADAEEGEVANRLTPKDEEPISHQEVLPSEDVPSATPSVAPVTATDTPVRDEAVVTGDSTQTSIQEKSAQEPVIIGEDAAIGEPSAESDKVGSTGILAAEKEPTVPTPVPVEGTPADIQESLKPEPTVDQKPTVPVSDPVQGSVVPAERSFEEKQAEIPANEQTVPNVTSEAQVDEAQAREAPDGLVAEPENEPSSQLQHDSSALAAVSTPFGDTQTESTKGLPSNDTAVSERTDAAAEPATQTESADSQDIVEPRAGTITDSATQVEDSAKPDVEPEAEPIHPSDETQVVKSKEPMIDPSPAVASKELQAGEVITEPVVADSEPVVGTEAADLTQSVEPSLVPEGEKEAELEDLAPRTETVEHAKAAGEAKTEPESISDKAQTTDEAQPESKDSVPHAEASSEAAPIHDTEAIDKDVVASEGLEPSVSDIARPLAPEAPSASEESDIPKDPNENIETQGTTQAEGGHAEARAIPMTEQQDAVLVPSVPAEIEPSAADSQGASSETPASLEQLVAQSEDSTERKPEIAEVSSTSRLPEAPVESPEPSANDESNSLQHEQPALPEVIDPSENVQKLPIADVIDPEGTDPAAEPVTQTQVINSKDIVTPTAAQGQEALEPKLDPAYAETEQQTGGEPVQSSDAPPESETKETPFAAAEESEARDNTPSTEDLKETETPANAAQSAQPSANAEAVEALIPKEAVSQLAQTDAPVPSIEPPTEVQPSFSADAAMREQSIFAPSTQDIVDSAIITDFAARPDPVAVKKTSLPVEEKTDTQPVVPSELDANSEPVAPEAEPEGTTSKESGSSEDSPVPAQEAESEVAPSQAAIETHWEPSAVADLAPANDELSHKPAPEAEAHAALATEHEDIVSSPSVVVPTNVEPRLADFRANETDSGVLLEQAVETAGAVGTDHGTQNSLLKPDALSPNVTSEPNVESQQEPAPEPTAALSDEVLDATGTEPILSGKAEAEDLSFNSDVPKTEVATEGVDSVAPSNGIAGTNGVILNGGGVDADTEANSAEKTSANQDQGEDHVVPLNDGVVPSVLKDLPVEGVHNLDDASNERALELLSGDTRREE